MFTGANTKRGSSYLTVSSASRGRNSESSSEGRTAAALSVPAPMGEPPVFYKKNGRFAELFRTIPEIS